MPRSSFPFSTRVHLLFLLIPCTASLFIQALKEIMDQFYTSLSYIHTLAGPSVMLLYPLYASVVATESPSKIDNKQWLAYWILYPFRTLFLEIGDGSFSLF